MEIREYNFVKREIQKLLGVDLNCYKTPQMQRRLKTFLLRSGQANWPSFFRAMQDDPVVLGKLKDYLTINVSSFFRDPEKYDYLKETILPQLLRGRPKLRVWSAGCSRGQEPYTLAMILREATGPFRRHRILATDLDHSALALAQAGGPYTADDVANVPSALLRCHFKVEDDSYWIARGLQRQIVFQQHNLLKDDFEEDYDLIVCRNVVIYFTGEVKERLYRRFHDALRLGGVLFVGGTEIVPRSPRMELEGMGIGFYRRNGAKSCPPEQRVA